MAKRMVRNVSAALLFAACSSAFGIENGQPLPAATNELLQMYPGTRVHHEQNRIRIIYGMPMTPGRDARNAASNWIQLHGEAFGCGKLEVRETYHVPFNDGSKTAISYQQYLNGVPVEYGALKVLVLNGAVPQVVYAAGTLAQPPAEGLAAPALTGETAVQIVRAMQAWRKVPQWSQAELVVFQGNGDWVAPTLAWKFVGEDPNVSAALRKTFFVNASTGALVHVRDEVLSIDVTGSLKGWGSPGVLPDEPYNPPALINIPDMRASIGGGNNVFSDSGGLFTIPHGGTTPVTVSATTGAGGGRWVTVVPVSGGSATASVNVTPPGPADLILNAVPAELLTAQINAFVCTTETHNYFKSRAPAYTGLDIAIAANTGVAGNCNAFFNGNSINFYNRLNGCANTAFTTVVSHEYGHFIVNRLGLSQNAFGEGYGDVSAMLIWDDSIVGRGFRQTQTSFVRDPIGANIQYPCNAGAVHTCGQILGGVWWRIRLAMGAFYGSQQGLDQTRQLEVNWSLITTGGESTFNSAGPGTAIAVLTVDDNDGNISNGTPNYSRICPSFAAHSITCPALALLLFQYPAGRPAEVNPNQATQISVNVLGNGTTPQPGSGTVSYRVGAGAFTTVPMVEGSPNQYTATLPAANCGQDINYYFSAMTTTSVVATDPPTAPTTYFTAGATIGTSNTTVVNLNFNSDPGWTVVNDPSLTSGAWERVTPLNPAAGTGAPATAFGGSGLCWVTDNRSGNFDVDGGPTTLLSSVYDLSAYPRITVSYQRWLYSTGSDPWTFQYSSNGGTTWTTLESVGGTTSAAWTAKSFDIAAPTTTMRFKWTLSDNPNDSVAEGGVDQFAITGLICPTTCYANCDGSSSVPILNVNDFVCFQNLYAAGSATANCDGSTTTPVLNVNDFICFQNLYAAGCP